jgi:hypothetical protein
LSTIKPTCCSDANPGRRGGKPATNRLIYGTAEGPIKYSHVRIRPAGRSFHISGLTERKKIQASDAAKPVMDHMYSTELLCTPTDCVTWHVLCHGFANGFNSSGKLFRALNAV